MKKEEYSYGVIYENIKGKKEAINEIESICPCCGNNDNLKKEERFEGIYKQTIYECDCGTKWRGNFYDENEEIVTYKDIKKANKRKKRESRLINIKEFFENYGLTIFFCISVIIILIGICFLFNSLFERTETENFGNNTMQVEQNQEKTTPKKETNKSVYSNKDIEEKIETENTQEITKEAEVVEEAEVTGELEELEDELMYMIERLIRLMLPVLILTFSITIIRYIISPRY